MPCTTRSQKLSCQRKFPVNLRPTLTYMVDVQSGVTNRLIPKLQHECIENTIVALSYDTSLFKDVPAKSFPCTKRICECQAMMQRFN